MKKIVFLYFISIIIVSNLFGQRIYQIDSLTRLTLEGVNFINLSTFKYNYDVKNRLISQITSYSVITYEYLNEFDYVKTEVMNHNGLPGSKVRYTFNNAAYILEEYYESFDNFQQKLTPAFKLVYSYDDQNRIDKILRYGLLDSGEEILSYEKTYLYNDIGIIQEKHIQFTSDPELPFFIRTTDHKYNDDKIIFSSIQNKYQSQVINSEIVYHYEDGKLILSQEDFFLNGEPTNSDRIVFEHSEHGIESFLLKRLKGTTEYKEFNRNYHSENITAFYTHDTILFKKHQMSEDFEDQKIFNSVTYKSEKKDTALVREEIHLSNFDLTDFKQISKKIYILRDESSKYSEEDETVAIIYPNPAIAGNFVVLKKIDQEIDAYEIINSLGQVIVHGAIWNDKVLINTPDQPGHYYIRFYQKSQAKGTIIKLHVF